MMKFGRREPHARADYVEICMVKCHNAADLFAWGGCHGDARCAATTQSKF